jgi:hypothetical protein
MPRRNPPPRFPPGAHLKGGLASIPVNIEMADEFCRAVAPVALELERAGWSLRAIGKELAKRGITSRNGWPGQPWSPSSVRRLLARAKHLAAKA